VPTAFRGPLSVNFVGRFCAGLVSLIATPLYVHWLGLAGYGIVGFYLVTQVVLGFLNGGLASAANREVAVKLEAGPAEAWAKQAALGRLVWFVSLVAGGLLAAGAGWLATHWLADGTFPPAETARAIRVAAVALALQAPIDFHVGALLGRDRYVAANLLLVLTVAGKAAAAVAVLAWWSPTVEAFFWSQAGVLLVAAVGCEIGAWRGRRAAGPAARAGWWQNVRESAAFSAGITGVAFTGMILGQADRIVLSRALTLEDFGRYTLATTLANLLYYLITPVQATYYPELSRLGAAGNTAALTRRYHEACRRMALLIMPAGAVLIFFARDVVQLWTHRADLALQTAPVVALLVGTRLISGLNTIPYTLQFSQGWTGLVLKLNAAAIAVFVPVVYLLARAYGGVGAAGGYLLLSLPFLAVVVWRMHRRLLPGEAGRWLTRDVLPAGLTALIVAAVCRWAVPAELGTLGRAAAVGLAGVATLGAALLTDAEVRARILRRPRQPAAPATP
jgi:O-antigen/teichoic acid export membrane protein